MNGVLLYGSNNVTYKITAKGGLAYCDYELQEDGDIFRNTDDGCFIANPQHRFAVMLDPGVTEFTLEIFQDTHTLTYSSAGLQNTFYPETVKGFTYISEEIPVPEKNADDMMLNGWIYEYTFRGETVKDYYSPGDGIIVDKDMTLTAEFREETWAEIFEFVRTDFKTRHLPFKVNDVFNLCTVKP